VAAWKASGQTAPKFCKDKDYSPEGSKDDAGAGDADGGGGDASPRRSVDGARPCPGALPDGAAGLVVRAACEPIQEGSI